MVDLDASFFHHLRQNRCRRRSSMEGRTRVYPLLVVEAEWTDGNGHYIISH
jgi:hypothetical protein